MPLRIDAKGAVKNGLTILGLLLFGACARTSGQEGSNPIDNSISDNVRMALLQDRLIAPDAGTIRVETVEGVVTLRGFVRTDATKKRAALVTRAVGSVVRVEDKIVVDAAAGKEQLPLENVVERTISDRVRMAFSEDRTIAAEARTVNVLTQDGVVRLSGTVGSEAVKARMRLVANAVGSVKRVDDRLAVKVH